MKKTTYLFMLLAMLVLSCSNPKQDVPQDKPADTKIEYAKQDLKKISWIEGNWRVKFKGSETGLG